MHQNSIHRLLKQRLTSRQLIGWPLIIVALTVVFGMSARSLLMDFY